MQNNPHNFNIAYLDKTDDSIIVTIMGRRRYMAHDLASALKDDYYIDSTKFVIPKNKEIVGKDEVRVVGSGYPIDHGGIWIKSDTLRVDLYFNDYDHHEIYSTSWNGTYAIFWRH